MTTSNMTQSQAEGVIRAGEVMATLNDWRAILFIMLFVMISLIGIIFYLVTSNRLERKAMVDERKVIAEQAAEERRRIDIVADKFTAAAAKLGENFGRVSEELAVLRAVTSRVESNVS